MATLLPEHIADLKRSGLTDDTISKMDVSSIGADDLDSRFKFAGVQSALRFEYLQLNGFSPFYRLKFFPPMSRDNGKVQKYYQPGETGCRLYIPEPIIDSFRDKNCSLILTEGEKKSWSGVQAGLPAVAIGGIYNFNDKETDWLIPELDEVLGPGRIVTYVPDSDVWVDPKKLESVFRLGSKIELRTGKFYVVKLPVGAGGSTTGLDDFLSAYGIEEFEKLRPVTLKDAAFAPFRKQQAFVNRKRAKAEDVDEASKIPIPDTVSSKLFHPALHIEKDFAAVGVTLREGKGYNLYILTDDGINPAKQIKESLTTKPVVHPELSGRWFASPSVPTLAESVGLCVLKLKELLSVENERWLGLLAIYAAGTYVFQLFNTFPYINLKGEQGSGKTKLIDTMSCVSFNAIQVIDPSPAVLFRMVHALRPTLLLDEAERLHSDDAREIRQIINAGYKRGATVPRCEGEGNELKFFEVYSPKILAAIKPIGATIEDRSIQILMRRPDPDDTRQNLEVNSYDEIWMKIRSGFYRAPFDYRDKIRKSATAALPQWLIARPRELWSPLLSIARVIDDEAALGAYDDLLKLCKETADNRGVDFETDAIVMALEDRLGTQAEINIHPVDLVESVEKEINGKVSPELIAAKLRNLGFSKGNPGRDKRGVIYRITATVVNEFRRWYSTPSEAYIPTPDETYTDVSVKNQKENGEEV
jgi:hypothetical protein